jgi:hypothetical protein
MNCSLVLFKFATEVDVLVTLHLEFEIRIWVNGLDQGTTYSFGHGY